MPNSTISITIFKSSTVAIGAVRNLSWAEFASGFVHEIGPKDGSAFACGTFKDCRRTTKNAENRSIIVLDVEQITSPPTGEIAQVPPSVDKIATTIKSFGYAAVIYTTSSHRPEAPRYRVIMPLDRLMPLPEGDDRSLALECDKELSSIVADMLGISECVDRSKFGISSIFFAPRCAEENLASAQMEVIEGAPLQLIDLTELASNRINKKNKERRTQAETLAKIAVEKWASKKTDGQSFIERLRSKLPDLSAVLKNEGYLYFPNQNRWLSPHSNSGIAGVVVLTCSDGIERAYVHHANDPLCGEREVFGVKAHDALDIMIAHRFGISDEDFRRGLAELSKEYGIEVETVNDPFDWNPSNNSDNWEDPLPFITSTIPAEYPLGSLPEGIRHAVQEVAGFVKAPISMIGSSALGAISLAAQAEADVKRAEGLSGPSSLFILVIAESGERKSTCDKFFTNGIRRFEEDATRKATPRIQQYKAASQAWEMKVKGVKALIQQLQKDGNSTKQSETDLEKLIKEEPKKPWVPRLLYSDTTSEELSHNLSLTWPSGGIMSAEGGLVFGGHSMGKDSAMRTFGLYNILWDGGTVHIDRRMSASFKIEKARLTILLQVQEAPLREFVLKTGDLARGTGFFARFLFCRPESTQGFRPFSEPPFYMPALEAFNDRLYEILDVGETIDQEGNLTPRMLSLSPEAKHAWVDFHDNIEKQLVTGGHYQDVRDVASKIADNAARLASIFHVYERKTGPITAELIAAAVAIVQWHLDKSLRFFSELSVTVEMSNAIRLERWMINSGKHKSKWTFHRNDLRQRGPIRERQALDAALDELTALKRVRCGSQGRTKIVSINPKILEG